MILESKPLHKKKKRLARKTKEQGSDGSPQVRKTLNTINTPKETQVKRTKSVLHFFIYVNTTLFFLCHNFALVYGVLSGLHFFCEVAAPS